ncbi:MAG: hypothetical protein H0X18_03665 [Geodermatophilaceae bacterium]|nr:hypothetical protein [Geodermatophilaceae bacterium]
MPESLYALALLACPVGMGLMMWMMMRGGSKQQPAEGETATKQAELTRMQAEIDQLQAERDHGRTDAPRPASS